jgi:uncharacterized protein YodC (DUF2158 family)
MAAKFEVLERVRVGRGGPRGTVIEVALISSDCDLYTYKIALGLVVLEFYEAALHKIDAVAALGDVAKD